MALALDLRGSSLWPLDCSVSGPVWKHPITVGNTHRLELFPHGSREADGEREVARILTYA